MIAYAAAHGQVYGGTGRLRPLPAENKAPVRKKNRREGRRSGALAPGQHDHAEQCDPPEGKGPRFTRPSGFVMIPPFHPGTLIQRLLLRKTARLLDICPSATYNRSMTDIKPPLPLTPAVFHILLALARGEKHGYELMKAVRQDSNGAVKMGNGTMYGSIKRMLEDRLIEDAGDRAEGDDTRRKYYRITALGRHAMNAEIKRYSDTLEVVRKYAIVPNR